MHRFCRRLQCIIKLRYHEIKEVLKVTLLGVYRRSLLLLLAVICSLIFGNRGALTTLNACI